ncbi:MAG: hypothetical protein QM811_28625 [Pirellulales bacterium]
MDWSRVFPADESSRPPILKRPPARSPSWSKRNSDWAARFAATKPASIWGLAPAVGHGGPCDAAHKLRPLIVARCAKILMDHPAVTFTAGDAFAFRPETPVDWLLCDVAAFPERSLELLTEWLTAKRCRGFVFTFKFRGTGGYELLPAIKAMLRAAGYDFQLRHLDANKNEMTALGLLA